MTARTITTSLFFACAMALAIATTACGESQLEPRAPDAMVITQPTGEKLWVPLASPEAPVEDHFWQMAAPEHRVAQYVPARSISLGYIGDEPLGVNGTPAHYEPAWTRPFPSAWTSSYSRGLRYGRRGRR